MRFKSLSALTLAGLALGSVGAVPASADTTVTMGQECYVATGIGQGATITASGAGFTPGEEVFAQIPAPGGLLTFGEATVGADGTFTATLPDVSPSSIEPVAEKETLQIKGILSEAILAEAPFELANLGVKTSPSEAPPNKKVTFTFSGFTTGEPIYAHYLHGKKVVATKKFGTAQGPCGLLKAKAKINPGGKKSHYSKYKVQFDDSAKYSKAASPRVNTAVSIETF